jgi:transposase
MAQVRTFAVDLAKHVFEISGETATGEVVYEHRCKSREAFWNDFVRQVQPGQEVLLETGPGAQAWARELQSRGAIVRVIPAQHVTEHRSGHKNDRKDTHALLRAGHDVSVHVVPIKSVEHLALQALHRVRSGYIRRHTALGNQMRGLLLEHGVVIRQGPAALSQALIRVLPDATQPVPDRLRDVLAELEAEWRHLEARIDALSRQLGQLAARDPLARRLMTVPGIGPIIASALLCKEVAIERFANARLLAAYFGLVPNQHSTGGRTRLGRMSRRGDRYLRSLLIEGAHAVVRRPAHASVQVQRWLQRLGTKAAAVRLANRNLRIVWSLLRHADTIYRPSQPRR